MVALSYQSTYLYPQVANNGCYRDLGFLVTIRKGTSYIIMVAMIRQCHTSCALKTTISEKNDAMGSDENCSCCNGNSSMEPTLLSKSAIVVFNAQEV
jgi:hypothetical protein